MGIEVKGETVSKLRNRLGREPTEDEVRAARDELIRKHYAAMLATDLMLRDEAKEFKPSSKLE